MNNPNDKVKEIDYYYEIVEYYDYSKNNFGDLTTDLWKWQSLKFINLVNDIKNEKQLVDADMVNVVTNSIILILNLFGKKKFEMDINSLGKKEKKDVLNKLRLLTENF